MVTFACREIREGGLIKFFIAKFILATCESREDFFVFSFYFLAYYRVGTLKNLRYSCNSQKYFLSLPRELTTYDMTAIDLRASTMQILERFDKTDTSLWQKVLDAINSIYKNEEEAQQAKRAQQKAKIRQMVGILHEESVGDWKREKEEALVEKYQ